ncbi:MAG: hypothetical protein WBQ14_08890 [Gaiellaceae bacterium]
MSRAAALATIVLVLVSVACGAKSREHENARGAANLRAATVSIDIYWTAHNTYAGMTFAKLRSIDRSIKDISIVKAGKTEYCIETTTGDPHVFLNGPAGPFMLGSCGDPKNGKPYAPPPKMPPKEFGGGSNESSDARYPLRASIAAIETYYQDHNTYAGMTLAELRYIDPWIPDISIVSAKKKTYCIEATGGDSRIFKNGPTGEMMIGSCADPTNGKPYEPPPSEEPEPSSSSEPLDGAGALRSSIPAIEAYWQDHNAYTGMTASKLRETIDAGLPEIKIVSAKKNTYCIEIAVGGASSFVRGPMGAVMQGHCPA